MLYKCSNFPYLKHEPPSPNAKFFLTKNSNSFRCYFFLLGIKHQQEEQNQNSGHRVLSEIVIWLKINLIVLLNNYLILFLNIFLRMYIIFLVNYFLSLFQVSTFDWGAFLGLVGLINSCTFTPGLKHTCFIIFNHINLACAFWITLISYFYSILLLFKSPYT